MNADRFASNDDHKVLDVKNNSLVTFYTKRLLILIHAFLRGVSATCNLNSNESKALKHRFKSMSLNINISMLF